MRLAAPVLLTGAAGRPTVDDPTVAGAWERCPAAIHPATAPAARTHRVTRVMMSGRRPRDGTGGVTGGGVGSMGDRVGVSMGSKVWPLGARRQLAEDCGA